MNQATVRVGELQRVAVDLQQHAGGRHSASGQIEEGRGVAAPRGTGAVIRRLATLRLLGWQPADALSRIVVGALFLMLAIRIAGDALQTGRVTGLLLVASEGLVVVLMIIRRPTAVVDRRWIARGMTALSMAGPPLVRPVGVAAAASLAPALASLRVDAVTASVSAIGLAIVIASKISLGRSFGLVPANRGIVSSGPYRFVRHPIYLGYLVTHVAFLVANPLLWNLLLIAASDTALIVRSLHEERTLQNDATYRQYQGRVRWRLVPGMF